MKLEDRVKTPLLFRGDIYQFACVVDGKLLLVGLSQPRRYKSAASARKAGMQRLKWAQEIKKERRANVVLRKRSSAQTRKRKLPGVQGVQ